MPNHGRGIAYNYLSSPIGLAILCYAMWGFAPLVYLPMHAFGAGAIEIMAHRSFWSLVCTFGLVWYSKQFSEVISIFQNNKIWPWLMVSAVLMALNWGIFVWAVLDNRLIEASLGYYINPLLNMAAGAVLFKERIDKFGIFAIIMAIIGVIIQAYAIGHIPYVAIFLAFSFASYGIIRKKLPINALPGLLAECMVLFLPALIYIIWFEAKGEGHFFLKPENGFWLMLTGPITVLPLALFSYVAKRLALSTMGFIQFIGPTIGFFIGLSLGESFSLMRAVSFAFIWAGAIVFAMGAWHRFSQFKPLSDKL